MLLSEDEARMPMVPTATATLGVKGHRPQVETTDNKDKLYVFASVNVVTAKLHTQTLECPKNAAKQTGKSKTKRLQEAFAVHLMQVSAAYPKAKHKRVVMIVDNATWHGGRIVKEALKANSQIELYRLPSYSPQLNVIERFWKRLRRRATHNRLFDTLKDMKKSIRNSVRYFQTVKSRIKSMLGTCYSKPPEQTPPAGS